MAIAQIDGSAASKSTTNNNGGTIRAAGTIASPKFQNQNLGDSEYIKDTLARQGAEVSKSISAGTFNKLRENEYVIRKVSTKIGDVANDVLLSGASDYGQRRSIHFVERLRSSFLNEWTWTRDSDGNVTFSGVVSTNETDFGTDDAARVSAFAPGELTYRDGGPDPVNDDYKRKYLA